MTKKNLNMSETKHYTLGALCAGYGGIELGLQMVMEANTAWVSDIEEIPKVILSNRFKSADGSPTLNYGDLTSIENPAKVDIVAAGFPCQPVSVSGLRQGVNDDRWLIDDVCKVAKEAGAKWLILENVRGIFTANKGGALLKVWNALIRNGYTRFEWGLFKASDVGAPHQRERWFCLATNTHSESLNIRMHGSFDDRLKSEESQIFGAAKSWAALEMSTSVLSPDIEWIDNRKQSSLFPQPLKVWPTDGSSMGTGLLYDQTKPRQHGLDSSEFKTLPTPTAREYKDAGPNVNFARIAKRRGLTGVIMHELCKGKIFSGWEQYGPAISEWSKSLNRAAPTPLEQGKFGYLSPKFVEWMMGLPEGWVTGRDIDLQRSEALHALGNGVVPHQLAYAIQILHNRMLENFRALSQEDQKLRQILDLRQKGLSWEAVGSQMGYSGSSGPWSYLRRRVTKYEEKSDKKYILTGS